MDRDELAARAMAAIIVASYSGNNGVNIPQFLAEVDGTAEMAYKMADAMLVSMFRYAS